MSQSYGHAENYVMIVKVLVGYWLPRGSFCEVWNRIHGAEIGNKQMQIFFIKSVCTGIQTWWVDAGYDAYWRRKKKERKTRNIPENSFL